MSEPLLLIAVRIKEGQEVGGAVRALLREVGHGDLPPAHVTIWDADEIGNLGAGVLSAVFTKHRAEAFQTLHKPAGASGL